MAIRGETGVKISESKGKQGPGKPVVCRVSLYITLLTIHIWKGETGRVENLQKRISLVTRIRTYVSSMTNAKVSL